MINAGGFQELGEFLHTKNPFALKTPKGRFLVFEQYKDIYLHVLKEIRKYCKRGYIDYPVLLRHFTNMTEDATMHYNDIAMKKYALLRETCIIVNWEQVNNHQELFIQILKAMHEVTQSDFDFNHFEMAWSRFLEYNENYGKEEKER